VLRFFLAAPLPQPDLVSARMIDEARASLHAPLHRAAGGAAPARVDMRQRQTRHARRFARAMDDTSTRAKAVAVC